MTTELVLPSQELDLIYQKMIAIDFFAYPDRFSIPVDPNCERSEVTPFYSYMFEVTTPRGVKILNWDDQITVKNDQAAQLRELTQMIRTMIESKDEYKKLPQARGGYV